ncbi:hypothetical protein B0H14DRAFT_2378966 [Mycena olivaceomarginata]|nr:hypothetical protein B0H14DRAFT_2378966 [Mycena olivaceomarginata]
MSNGAVPRTKLENEFHVRFVATSPFASPLEIMQGVRASIEDTFDVPVAAWDCEGKEEVLLRPYGLLFAGDNPMQAELCSCAGLNTNYLGLATVPYTITVVLDTAVQEHGRGIATQKQ